MTLEGIYKEKKVNTINTITCVIEETYIDNYSILIFDEEGGVWIEKFADTYNEAVVIADKLFLKVCNQY
jgi:hypothetical protein